MELPIFTLQPTLSAFSPGYKVDKRVFWPCQGHFLQVRHLNGHICVSIPLRIVDKILAMHSGLPEVFIDLYTTKWYISILKRVQNKLLSRCCLGWTLIITVLWSINRKKPKETQGWTCRYHRKVGISYNQSWREGILGFRLLISIILSCRLL